MAAAQQGFGPKYTGQAKSIVLTQSTGNKSQPACQTTWTRSCFRTRKRYSPSSTLHRTLETSHRNYRTPPSSLRSASLRASLRHRCEGTHPTGRTTNPGSLQSKSQRTWTQRDHPRQECPTVKQAPTLQNPRNKMYKARQDVLRRRCHMAGTIPGKHRADLKTDRLQTNHQQQLAAGTRTIRQRCHSRRNINKGRGEDGEDIR